MHGRVMSAVLLLVTLAVTSAEPKAASVPACVLSEKFQLLQRRLRQDLVMIAQRSADDVSQSANSSSQHCCCVCCGMCCPPAKPSPASQSTGEHDC